MVNHKVEIDWDEVARLAQLQCTEVEIAFVCHVARQTLLNRCIKDQNCCFGDFIENNRQGGKMSLRRLQWKSAEGVEGELLKDDNGKLVIDDKGRPQFKVLPVAPSITMQIWLGKQYLGQSDKQELAGPGGGPITITEVEVVKS